MASAALVCAEGSADEGQRLLLAGYLHEAGELAQVLRPRGTAHEELHHAITSHHITSHCACHRTYHHMQSHAITHTITYVIKHFVKHSIAYFVAHVITH